MQSLFEFNSCFSIEPQKVELREGIPRYTPDISYSSGNFSMLRERHPEIQIDSKNGTQERLNLLLERTNWPASFFKGKVILECGCGAGADTEALTALGAKVLAVDLCGVDTARSNLEANKQAAFIQASITDLPLKPSSFDIVFCHRVLQHTPHPRETLEHILSFVKPEGAVFVHSYARTFHQMFRWKYAMRPLTKRMPPDRLYRMIEGYAAFAYRFTNATCKLGLIGRAFNHLFVPFYNYRHRDSVKALSDEAIIAYGVHDTFDALSPAYDQPISARQMRRIGQRRLKQPFEIVENRAITLLRTKTAGEQQC